MPFDPISNAAARKANTRLDAPTLRAPLATDDAMLGYAAAGEGRVGKLFPLALGSGYTSATVALSAPPAGGTQATAIALLLSGTVVDFLITNPGKGYSAAPTVTITGDGTGATAASSLALASIWQAQGEIYAPMRTNTGAAAWRRKQPSGLPSTPKAVWGFRRLVPGYTGPGIQVVRASDSTTLDVSFLSSGHLDEDALRNFGYGTSLTISIVYDQTGNTFHLTQTTAANRPAIYVGNYLNGPGSPLAGTNLALLFNAVTGTWMNMPAGMTFSSAAMSAFIVARVPGSYVTTGIFELTHATQPFQLFYGGSSFRLSLIGAGQSKAAPMKPRADANVYGFTHGTIAGLRIFAGHESYTQSIFASAITIAGGKVGFANTVGAEMDWSQMVIYDREITEAERQDLTAILCQHNKISPQVSDTVILRGDSIRFGLKSTQMRYPARLIEQNLGLPARYYSAARSGDEGIIMAGRFNADVAPLLNPGAKNNVLLCAYGTNDFTASNATAQAVFDALMSDAAKARALVPTVKIIAATVLNRGVFTAGQAASAAAYNALIKANAGPQRLDAIVDYTVDPDFGPASWTTGPYQADSTHPNDAGYALMAATDAAAIRLVWQF